MYILPDGSEADYENFEMVTYCNNCDCEIEPEEEAIVHISEDGRIIYCSKECLYEWYMNFGSPEPRDAYDFISRNGEDFFIVD